jgi:hypothetical protein
MNNNLSRCVETLAFASLFAVLLYLTPQLLMV